MLLWAYVFDCCESWCYCFLLRISSTDYNDCFDITFPNYYDGSFTVHLHYLSGKCTIHVQWLPRGRLGEHNVV